jgi:D-alanine--poly(phosphoribitol) ligase subunit 1
MAFPPASFPVGWFVASSLPHADALELIVPDVLQGIIDQARTGPDLPAVKDQGRDLTYAELLNEVARCATGLAEHDVVEGDRVALHLPNSVDFVVTALSCLWIGAIFVPLAMTDPEARLATMLSDCTPTVVVTTDEHAEEMPRPPWLGQVPLVPISALRSTAPDLRSCIDGSSRGAYAMYTSGTTGTPKGVLIGTRAFGAAVDATSKALELTRATRTLCVSPFYFDGSFATLFPTLFSGGAVVIRPFSLLFSRTFVATVLKENITYTGFSPSFLRLLLANPQIPKLAESSLDVIALGGEASSIADLRALWSIAPNIRIFNRYGPTETTIVVTHQYVTPELVAEGTVPIGYPHPFVTFHLVGESGEIIEDSERVGELYIGGAQLMTGYWGAPELTKEVLRTDIVPGETVYRTGDLVFRDKNGNFVYVDRADRVINRHGLRISLVELSEAVRTIEHVSAAACVTFDDDGEVGIAAFVVADQPVSAIDLRDGTLQRIPEAMLPNRYEQVEVLPVNKSNKLDEHLLLSRVGLRPASKR